MTPSGEASESMSIHDFNSSDQSDNPIERVQNHSLPDSSVRLIESYDEIVGDRSRFLWKWAHHLFPKFTLSSVDSAGVERLQDDKLTALMFVSILDDVGEMHQDRATFEEATKIPFDHQTVNYDRPAVDSEVLQFASDVWEQFSPTLQSGPRADEFEEIVAFNVKQVLNAIDYSYVANQNIGFITESELRTYDAHNMMLYVFADIDLIHSTGFDRSELSRFRRVIERVQRMVRIGNWITTWEREITEGDFTSGIVAHALDEGILSADELRASRDTGGTDSETIINTIHDQDVEDVFVRQWEEELAAARKFEGAFDTVDVGAYLDGIETVMEYHVASRGLK